MSSTSANENTEKDPETGITGINPALEPWSPRLPYLVLLGVYADACG